MNEKTNLFTLGRRICSAAAIIVTLLHLLQLCISLEKLHTKLDNIAYCVGKDLLD